MGPLARADCAVKGPEVKVGWWLRELRRRGDAVPPRRREIKKKRERELQGNVKDCCSGIKSKLPLLP